MTPRRGELATIVGLVVALLGIAWFVADRTTETLHPYQVQMVELLDGLGGADVDHRVVVLGTSLDRNALGTAAELSAVLSTEDRRVGAVNLGYSAAGYETFAPILDRVWAADPDVLVLQPDVFRPEVRDDENTLRERLRRRFDPPDLAPLDTRRCPEQTDRAFETSVERNLARHTTTVPYVAEALELVHHAARNGVAIVLYVPPRSPPIIEAIDGVDEAWRAVLFDALAGEPNVIGPVEAGVELGLDSFCDWTHVNDDGRAVVSATVAALVHEALDRSDG
ncbi:MAG: hypothetical protein R8F63_11075 [Acidimicrobiales bacterium]|nr:hypothetical protein [Acidimicrobiales bacterium]